MVAAAVACVGVACQAFVPSLGDLEVVAAVVVVAECFPPYGGQEETGEGLAAVAASEQSSVVDFADEQMVHLHTLQQGESTSVQGARLNRDWNCRTTQGEA